MTTVINSPGNSEDATGAIGAVVGIVLLILAIVLFFMYGLPMIRNSNAPAQEQSKTNNLDIKVTTPKNETPQTQPNP